MKLIIKQTISNWNGSCNIYQENGEVLFIANGHPSWGHMLRIFDAQGHFLGALKEEMMSTLPRYELYNRDGSMIAYIDKSMALMKPRYTISSGFTLFGDYKSRNYGVILEEETIIETHKEVDDFTDGYTMEVKDNEDCLLAVLIALSIDIDNGDN